MYFARGYVPRWFCKTLRTRQISLLVMGRFLKSNLVDLTSYTDCVRDSRQVPLTLLLCGRMRALEPESTLEIPHHSALLAVCGSYMRFVRFVKSRQRSASRPEQAVIINGRYGTVIEHGIGHFGAAVLAPDYLAPGHLGAGHFGARTFWRQDIWAPDNWARECKEQDHKIIDYLHEIFQRLWIRPALRTPKSSVKEIPITHTYITVKRKINIALKRRVK